MGHGNSSHWNTDRNIDSFSSVSVPRFPNKVLLALVGDERQVSGMSSE